MTGALARVGDEAMKKCGLETASVARGKPAAGRFQHMGLQLGWPSRDEALEEQWAELATLTGTEAKGGAVGQRDCHTGTRGAHATGGAGWKRGPTAAGWRGAWWERLGAVGSPSREPSGSGEEKARRVGKAAGLRQRCNSSVLVPGGRTHVLNAAARFRLPPCSPAASGRADQRRP